MNRCIKRETFAACTTMSVHAERVSNLGGEISGRRLRTVPDGIRSSRSSPRIKIPCHFENPTGSTPQLSSSLSIVNMSSSQKTEKTENSGLKRSVSLPPRWKLQLQAQTWRSLMAFGMTLHKRAPPRPPAPSFRKRIPTTLSPQRGLIDLLFYTPVEYQRRPPDLDGAMPVHCYPVVVNFHGGGFTIGSAGDDERWAASVVGNVNAVVVSVEYRLAPEHPFPTAVEDGVDAILYLIDKADELGIDRNRIAVSGFSAGGNMAFSVPLKLQDVLHNPHPEQEVDPRVGFDSIVATAPATIKKKFNPIVAIVAWYPSTDFATSTRPERRLSNMRPDKELPQFFTTLFDASYLHPLKEVPLSSPYLSPGLAPVAMLRALPDHIIMYTCEWDELLVEAERMRDRLRNEAGKQVIYRKVLNVAHAWDKTTNPLRWDPEIEAVYTEACTALRKAFEAHVDDVDEIHSAVEVCKELTALDESTIEQQPSK